MSEKDYPASTAILEVFNSKADYAGNRYFAFTFTDIKSGKSVSATISGGESNLKAVMFNFNGSGDWDRSIRFSVNEMGIRAFNRLTNGWPYAGCNPDELRDFIKKSLDSNSKM